MFPEMFPEFSQLVHDFIRPKTRPDWRRLHKYTDDDFKRDLVRNNYEKALLKRADGGFTVRFKQLKTLEYQGYNYRIIKVTDNVIVLKRYFTQYYFVYSCGGLFKGPIYYRNTDQILFLAEKHHFYIEELIIICLGIIIWNLFCGEHLL